MFWSKHGANTFLLHPEISCPQSGSTQPISSFFLSYWEHSESIIPLFPLTVVVLRVHHLLLPPTVGALRVHQRLLPFIMGSFRVYHFLFPHKVGTLGSSLTPPPSQSKDIQSSSPAPLSPPPEEYWTVLAAGRAAPSSEEPLLPGGESWGVGWGVQCEVEELRPV